jgi:hypothetical protein
MINHREGEAGGSSGRGAGAWDCLQLHSISPFFIYEIQTFPSPPSGLDPGRGLLDRLTQFPPLTYFNRESLAGPDSAY